MKPLLFSAAAAIALLFGGCGPDGPRRGPQHIGPGASTWVDEACEAPAEPIDLDASVALAWAIPAPGCEAGTQSWSTVSTLSAFHADSTDTRTAVWTFEQTTERTGQRCVVSLTVVPHLFKAGQPVPISPFDAEVALCAVRIESPYASLLQGSDARLDQLGLGPADDPTPLWVEGDAPVALEIGVPQPLSCEDAAPEVFVEGYDHAFEMRYSMPLAALERAFLDGSVRVAFVVHATDERSTR